MVLGVKQSKVFDLKKRKKKNYSSKVPKIKMFSLETHLSSYFYKRWDGIRCMLFSFFFSNSSMRVQEKKFFFFASYRVVERVVRWRWACSNGPASPTCRGPRIGVGLSFAPSAMRCLASGVGLCFLLAFLLLQNMKKNTQFRFFLDIYMYFKYNWHNFCIYCLIYFLNIF